MNTTAGNTIASTIYATTDTPLGNGAFTADGRLVVSHHPMYLTPHRVSVFTADGSLAPFPNLAWNTPGDDPMAYLDAVLGLHDDSQGRVWLADMGTRSGIPAKLVVWDTIADALSRVIPIPPATLTPFSEPNDFVVDEVRGKVYIADEGAGGGGDGSRAALIVIDLATGTATRRLEGHDGIKAELGVLTIAGREVAHDGDGTGRAMRVGVDGVAMDRAGTWLYLSPLNGHTLWRLRVTDLLDTTLDDAALAKRMVRFAPKPNSGGMAFDDAGNLYLTVIETNAIGRVSPAGVYDEPVVRDDMFWPDGLMQGPDRAMYVVCTQLPRSPALARSGEKPELPFKVFRFDPATAAQPTPRPSVRPASPLVSDLVRGAVAGTIAAVVVAVFQTAWTRLRLPPTDVPTTDLPATETLADMVSTTLTGQVLAPARRHTAGTGIHLATGAALGVAYVLLDRRASTSPTVSGGTVFGLEAWIVVEEIGLAVCGIKAPPWRVAAAEHVFAAASHIVFGGVTGALLAVAPRDG